MIRIWALLLPAALVAPIFLAAAGRSPSSAPAASNGSEWSAWRGPHGTGLAEGDAPTTWAADKNVAWKIPIEGRGVSTPVIWGDKLFLTTAVQRGEAPADAEPEPEPEEGGRGRGRGPRPGGLLVEHDFDVLCFDKQTGKTLWRQTAITATPHEGYHKTYGSFASNSPVTDGEHLFAFFGSRGIYCYDLDGELVWKKDFGVEMEMRRAFGEGVAPVIHGDSLVLNFDQEGPSFIVVLDKNTGEERWRKDRDELSTWAPPLVTEVGDRTEVIVSGANAVRSYALEDGELIWQCSGLGTNPIPTPVRVGDSVLVMTGHRDVQLMSIALGGEGDLSETDAVRWSTAKGTAYTASPVYMDGLFYSVSDRGFISCFDAESGEPHYLEQRLPRGFTLKASPVATAEHLYVVSERGEVAVLESGPELKVHGVMPALEDELWLASPVIDEGALYLRSLEHLYCIREGLEVASEQGASD
jgi:outer membrane protein assembly factor BamB